MPVVIVYGVRENYEELEAKIKLAVSSVAELRLSPASVSVFFPEETTSHQKEVVAFVEGLSQEPERTAAVLETLAKVLGKCLFDCISQRHFTKQRQQTKEIPFIEVFVKSFDQKNGGFVRL